MTRAIRSIFAGIAIAIGGTVYLSVDNKVTGAALFSIGLLLVCYMGFDLYTGRVPYMKFGMKSLWSIVKTVIFNFVGSSIIGIVIGFIKPELHEKAVSLCELKLSEGWLIIPLAIFCNMLIFFAVDICRRSNKNDLVCITSIVICVMVFILCGFEHSIANIFYFSAARMINLKVSIYLLLNVIFNGIGGIAIYRLYKRTIEMVI